jgi:hypothetical protein
MRRAAAIVAACSAVALVKGSARAEGPAPYTIEAPVRVEAEVGSLAEVSFSIVPEAGFMIAREAPFGIELRPEPEALLELPRTRYLRQHAADSRARAPRYDLQVRPRQAGTSQLSITSSFWICRRRSCLPVRDSRTIEVAARAPGEARAAP